MNTFSAIINDLEDFLEKVSSPNDFFQENRENYLKLAQDVAGQVLETLKPSTVDSDVWERRVVAMKRNILYGLLQNKQGFKISYTGARKDPDEERGLENEIDYNDVLEWVEAGLAGDPEGKDVTKYEGSSRSPEEIADTVYRAVSSPGLGVGEKDYGPIRARIEEYYAREVGTGLAAFMETVLDAWVNIFVAVVERDLVEWLEKRLKML